MRTIIIVPAYNEALNKIGDIVEIIMVMLNCSYLDAFLIVVNSSTGKAILEGDMATMYQSAACCIEDIGREISKSKYAKYFSDECISRAIDSIRSKNEKMVRTNRAHR